MATPILVPRRAGDPLRDRLWSWLRADLERELPGFPIVEGHHELGPFSRSAALNRAAREAPPWDVAIILDADTHVPPEQIRRAVTTARKTGRLTYAFDELHSLNRAGTERILAGFRGSWAPYRRWSRGDAASSALAVPRELWDAVGGFDERFAGWGWEDVAFRRSAVELGGPEERIRGGAWHLWHPRSPKKNEADPDFVAAKALGTRYKRAAPDELRRLMAEAREARHRTAVVLMANGRREYLEQTLPGVRRLLVDPLVARLIVHDDSGDDDFRRWLMGELAGAPCPVDLVTTERAGYGGAMRSAFAAAARSLCPLVFWLEEDFVLDEVPLAGMADLLDARPELFQVVLKRQAWYPRELRAGGLIESRPGEWRDVADPVPHVEHRVFFSVNPTLFRAEVVARPWPAGRGSEEAFGRELLKEQPHRLFAFWGSIDSPPAALHVGTERAGHGY